MTQSNVSHLIPQVPPPNLACAHWECPSKPAILAWVLSGDADSMSATWNGLCRQHARDTCDRWVRELTIGGPCQSIMLVLP